MENIDILLVDDDESACSFIQDILNGIPGVSETFIAENGRRALTVLKQHRIQMVLLDIEMPGMDGLTTLRRIREAHPGVDVVMMSAAHESDADKVVTALESGAIDFIHKAPSASGTFQDFRLRLLTITGLVRSRLNRRSAGKPASTTNRSRENRFSSVPRKEETAKVPVIRKPAVELPGWKPGCPTKIDVVAIAISTGGPNALAAVIPQLPEKIGVPVFVIQHMPPFLTASLASSLDSKSSIKVKEAEDGETVRSNTVYIAAGGKHMTIENRNNGEQPDGKGIFVRLKTDAPINSVRPSADVLFRSLPDVYGRNILCVIMTGMGHDGLNGVRFMKKKGCYCLTQTAETCIVYGMPRSVDEADFTDEKVPLERIAERIVNIVMK